MHNNMCPTKSSIRVRFAPSPTGYLHIGSLRSALFNWLFARHHGGVFLLRIEDTDLERSKQDYLDSILSSFSWLEITSDEPILVQSERISIYQNVAQQLVEEKKAYRCYCTAQEVADRVGKHTQSGESYVRYDGKCRNVTDDNTKKPFVIRFKLPEFETFSFHDLVRDQISISRDQLDDFIIIRSDGMPMYNFVVVVDDAQMRISHIIRGEEHIINTPKQMLLAESCGYSIPFFAHIPLILGPSGEKLSKRDGAVSVIEYKRMGFLADALLTYLARLGWSHGDQEIFTRDELISYFTLEGIGKKGSMFDIEKLKWVNSYFLKQLTVSDIINLLLRDLGIDIKSETVHWNDWQREKAIILFQDRVATLVELGENVRWLYHGPSQTRLSELHSELLLEKTDHLLSLCIESLEKIEVFEKEHIATIVKTITKQESIPFVQLAKPLRIALLGVSEGPSLADIIMILSKDESIKRIRTLRHAIRK
jgi:glutamyl-tRNA synthetase